MKKFSNVRKRRIGRAQKRYFHGLSLVEKRRRLKGWIEAGQEAARHSSTRSISMKKYWASLSTLERWKRSKRWSDAGIKALNKKYKNTNIELKLKEVLRDNDIAFQFQKRVGAASIDFFIKPNICIFADGVYWHNIPKRKERDIKINSELIKQGYKVIRLPERMINEYPDVCLDTVQTIMRGTYM